MTLCTFSVAFWFSHYIHKCSSGKCSAEDYVYTTKLQRKKRYVFCACLSGCFWLQIEKNRKTWVVESRYAIKYISLFLLLLHFDSSPHCCLCLPVLFIMAQYSCAFCLFVFCVYLSDPVKVLCFNFVLYWIQFLKRGCLVYISGHAQNATDINRRTMGCDN